MKEANVIDLTDEEGPEPQCGAAAAALRPNARPRGHAPQPNRQVTDDAELMRLIRENVRRYSEATRILPATVTRLRDTIQALPQLPSLSPTPLAPVHASEPRPPLPLQRIPSVVAEEIDTDSESDSSEDNDGGDGDVTGMRPPPSRRIRLENGREEDDDDVVVVSDVPRRQRSNDGDCDSPVDVDDDDVVLLQEPPPAVRAIEIEAHIPEADTASTRAARERAAEDALARDSTCPICLSSPIDEPAMATACRHAFCSSCITTWLSRYSKACPICKRPLTKSALVFLSDKH